MYRILMTAGLIAISMAGCQSKQESTRRAAIGTWISPEAPSTVVTLGDGGAATIRQSQNVTSGTWNVSETGGISVIVPNLSATLIMRNGHLSEAEPNGSVAQFDRLEEYARKVPALTKARMATLAWNIEPRNCHWASKAAINQPGQMLAFYNFLTKALARDYTKISTIGQRSTYQQDGVQGSQGAVTLDAYLWSGGDVTQIDADARNFVSIDYCTHYISHPEFAILDQVDVTPGDKIIHFTMAEDETPIQKRLLSSSYSKRVGVPWVVIPREPWQAEFIYANGEWRLKQPSST